MQFPASTLAERCGGRLAGPDVLVEGATIDSRALRPGQLFVPVVAERDGHEFIAAALAAGAAAYLTAGLLGTGTGTGIVVADTVAALADLGRLARDRLEGPVVGITGSVGKTSTKDLCAAALRTTLVTAAADKSFNNELGVPLTLFNGAADTAAAVVEMGARGVGHIAHLCSIARPTIGVVTCVGAAHLELFGTIQDVARGKGELVEALPGSGTAVLNGDDPLVAAMAGRTRAAVLRFGLASGCDLTAEGVVFGEDLHARFTLRSPWGAVAVSLGVAGRHMVTNALAAAGAALAAGVPLEAVAAGLGQAVLSPWRMEVGRSAGGATIINDAYNANPMSMRAALDTLAAVPATRRVAVLGQMAELGPDSDQAHRDVAAHAAAIGVELVAVGTTAYGAPSHERAAIADLLGPLGGADAVLVKASRVAGLELVAAQLLEAGAHA